MSDTHSAAAFASPFRSHCPAAPAMPVVIAAPHGGRQYAGALRAAMRDADYSTLRLEDRHIDAIAAAVAERCGVGSIIADAPRALIDLNRSPDDIDWGMVAHAPTPEQGRRPVPDYRRAQGGLGLVPRRLAGHGEIWRHPLDYTELQRRIATIHEPYHVELERLMESVAATWGGAVVIDLHSMPPLKPRSGAPAAEVVLGDRFGATCAHSVSERALHHFDRAGRIVAHNRPYAGGYTLSRHGRPSRGMHAMQIEICRSSYLDSHHKEVTPRMEGVIRLLCGMVQVVAAEVAELAAPPRDSLAAE